MGNVRLRQTPKGDALKKDKVERQQRLTGEERVCAFSLGGGVNGPKGRVT